MGARTPEPGRGRTGIVEWTPANIVTVVRICLIPAFVALLLAPWAEALLGQGALAANVQAFCSMGLFALISLTDSLDGYLARSRNEVTVFGKFMDPIADKVLVVSALTALVQLGQLPAWIPIVIVARELLVSGLRMLVASAGVVVAANWIGKAKTFTTMVAICLFIVADAPALSGAQPWFAVLSWVVMASAVVLTVVSMVDYFAHSWPLLADGQNARAEHRPARGGADSPAEPADPCGGADVRTSALEGEHGRAASVLAAARARGATIATAESCTGGLVAAALTSVPGSSESVAGGVVSYLPSVKRRVLGVDGETIERHGVVSCETAAAMATGARALLESDLAVSTTGIAGPGGAEDGKPVGTVCFAVATPDGVRSERRVFAGTRREVRAQAVDHALLLLERELKRTE